MAVVCLHGQDQSGSENRVYTEYVKVPLDSGSLLIMEGAMQHDWQVTFTGLESQSRGCKFLERGTLWMLRNFSTY